MPEFNGYTQAEENLWYEMQMIDCESLDLICESEQDIESVLMVAARAPENDTFFRKYNTDDPKLIALAKTLEKSGYGEYLKRVAE